MPPLAYAASPINGDAQRWDTYPQVMFTFFKKHANDLKDQTVIPFTTHEGSGLANCVEDVKAAFACQRRFFQTCVCVLSVQTTLYQRVISAGGNLYADAIPA